jgi:hypothetical protein
MKDWNLFHSKSWIIDVWHVRIGLLVGIGLRGNVQSVKAKEGA